MGIQFYTMQSKNSAGIHTITILPLMGNQVAIIFVLSSGASQMLHHPLQRDLYGKHDN